MRPDEHRFYRNWPVVKERAGGLPSAASLPVAGKGYVTSRAYSARRMVDFESDWISAIDGAPKPK
jgi:hypothetical protein